MGIQLPGELAPALAMMNVRFPATDEDALNNAAQEWQSIAQQCQDTQSGLKDAIIHVTSNNSGPAVQQYGAYMSGKSNVTGTQALGEAAQALASGSRRAAALVAKYKTMIIAEASVVRGFLILARGYPTPTFKAQAVMMARAAGQRVRTMDYMLSTTIRSGG